MDKIINCSECGKRIDDVNKNPHAKKCLICEYYEGPSKKLTKTVVKKESKIIGIFKSKNHATEHLLKDFDFYELKEDNPTLIALLQDKKVEVF